MMGRIVSQLGVVLALVGLAGCADLTPMRREAPAPRLVRTCHPSIALAGRFSVQYQKDEKKESVHGSFRWGQDNKNMRIVLMSPMGQTLATIDVTPDNATLTNAEKISRTADDVDALVQDSLGWPLPVSGLRDWIQACMRDERGRRIGVTPESRELTTSDGWRVAYPVWEDDARSGRRPRRIVLHHSEGAKADISVKIIIDEWMPHP